MKYSELHIDKLTNNEIYDLVMTGIKDFSEEEPSQKTNPDFLIVLGCSPVPLKARVIKMMQLYKKGYGKYVLFSGGTGWHKIFKPENKNFKDEKSKTESLKLKAKKLKKMKKALRDTVGDELRPDKNNPFKHHKKTLLFLNKTEAQIGYKIMKTAQDIINIDDSRIFFEQNSITTLQNLEYSKKLLEKLQSDGTVPKIKRVMLITSSFHCRRAELNFKKFFPDIDVLSCPATLDILNKGLSLSKESLTADEYYMTKIKNELSAIINYSKNGNIYDLDISNILGNDIAKRIERKHSNNHDEIGN